LAPGNAEGRLAVARAAVDARDFDAARAELKAVFAERPSQRACLMMADLEEAEHGDRGRVREWLARAVRSPRDPVWTADGVISETWAPVSPVSGRLDAFEWKVPVESLGGPGGPLVDEALFAPPPEPEAEPVVAATVVAPAAAASGARGPAQAGGSQSPPPARPPEADDAVRRPPGATAPTDPAPSAGELPFRAHDRGHAAQLGAPHSLPAAPGASPVQARSAAREVLVMPSSSDGAPPGGPAASERAEQPRGLQPAAAPTPAAERAGPRLVEFPLTHSPDDPGPAEPDDAVSQRPRRRLF
jgi:HemY protein